MVRLHQEAIAQSAAHAMDLEADMNSGSSSELKSLSKELNGKPTEKEAKTDETNEMVWHPYVACFQLFIVVGSLTLICYA